MKSLIISILLLSAILSIAQTNTVNGNVNDQQNAPVEFANVLLLLSKDSTLVKGNMTDEKGFFSFENIPSNEYIVSINQVGMEKYYSDKFVINEEHSAKEFGKIYIKNEAATLKEVVITSKVPLFERKPDKTVVNVSSDLMASSSSALDVLKKSPGVVIDKDDNIGLKGKSGVMVMIDGKQTYLSSEQLTTMLSNMSASQIDKIELITNPSSKYDAEGTAGIINIKLNKAKMYGTNGNISASVTKATYFRGNTNLNFNHRTEKLNVFGNFNSNTSTRLHTIDIVRNFNKDGGLENIFNQNSSIKEQEWNNSIKAGLDYFINEKNTLGIVVNGRYNPENRDGDNLTSIYNNKDYLISSVKTMNRNETLSDNYSLNLNYESKLDTAGTKLNLDADYAYFNTHDNGKYFYTDYDNSNIQIGETTYLKNNSFSKININSFKADLEKPIKKSWKISSGIKASSVNTDNDVSYYNIINSNEISDPTRSNHFKYGEDIYAAYGILGKEWKKVNIELGVRGEQTIAKGLQKVNDSSFVRSYFQIFPNASLSYIPSEKHQWGLSYSKRINRPDYQDMNPFRFFLDQYTFQQGNPFLIPELSNSYELSYTYMQFLTGVVSYSRTNNVMVEITRQNDSTHVTFVNKENLNINDNYSFTLSFPIPIGKWFTSDNSFTSFYNYYNSSFAGSTIKQGAWSYTFNSSNQILLKNNFSTQIDFRYNSPMVYGIFKMKPEYGLSIAIQKKIFHERGRIKLSAQNIIRNTYQGADVKFQNMDFTFRQKRDNQFISLSFSYKFGKTTVAASRKHNTGADDEKNRVKN